MARRQSSRLLATKVCLEFRCSWAATPRRAIVQSAGHGIRVKAALLKSEFERFGPTMHLLLRLTQALITQIPTSMSQFIAMGGLPSLTDA